jgi:hypothetical protein
VPLPTRAQIEAAIARAAAGEIDPAGLADIRARLAAAERASRVLPAIRSALAEIGDRLRSIEQAVRTEPE